MMNLRRDDRHALLVTVLTYVVPWVTLTGAAGFLAWWAVSVLRGDHDDAAGLTALVFIALAAFAWTTRVALQGPDRDDDLKP